MRFGLLFALGIVVALLGHNPSHAVPINPADIGTTFFASTPVNPATVSYDAASDIFRIDQTLTSANPYVFFGGLLPATPVASDFIGTFALTATIDGAGNFFGGTFSLVGGSATLGIAAGTTVLEGSLHTFVNELGQPLSGVQFLSNPNIVDPLLQAAVGPINTLLINQCCISAGDFSASFSGLTASEGPDLFGTPRHSIPEPVTIAMFAVGLAGLGFMRRRRAS